MEPLQRQRSGFYTSLCFRGCLATADQGLPTASQDSHYVHGMSWICLPTSPYPTFLLAQNLSSKRFVLIDIFRPKLHDEYTRHQLLCKCMYCGINWWVYFQEKSTLSNNFIQNRGWAYFREITVMPYQYTCSATCSISSLTFWFLFHHHSPHQVLTPLLLLDCILQQWWFLVLVLVYHFLYSSYSFPYFAGPYVSMFIRGDKR